ncbi:zinc finger protein 665-like [Ochlerotatus camptorhynchus]|uniref:zinc finger protein 665-like n=1 Tax=Ochlerotatus camptorhynchus TaxID=644619 RepID=UPI0031CE5D0E
MEFYASICRLCESPDQTGNSWVELFSGKNEHLLAKIRACANIAISFNDGLPQRICGRCNLNLEHAYNFKMRCEITDTKLRREMEFLIKNDEKHHSPFDCSRFLLAQEGTKQDVIMAAEKVYVKAEPLEDEDFCSAKVETQLKVGVDWDPNEHKDELSDSEESDSENDFGAVEKEKSSEKPKPDVLDKKKGNICDICGDQFDKSSALSDHRKAKHPKQQYQCKQCSKHFTRKSYLEEHEVQHTGIRPYECPQCDKKYFTPSGLRSHMQDHGDNLPYVCDKCGKGFSTESKLRVHYAIHIETRDFICDLCNKGFKTLGVLNSHKTTHLPRGQQRKRTPRKKKDYVCQYCGKVSTHPGVHNMHMRTHTGEQRFECHICFKRFTSYGSHRKHLLVHTGEKPYVCQYCQKAFRQKHHMDTHIRGVHTKEKPYKCKFCPRAFATLGNMREHEKSHGESGRKHEVLPPTVNPGVVIPPEFGHFLAESTEPGSY